MYACNAAVLFVLFAFNLSILTATPWPADDDSIVLITDDKQPSKVNLSPPSKGDIYSYVIHSRIKHRYAQTTVSSRVANKGNTSQEVQFFVTLPETAFISKFLMEINEKVYEAYVKEKKEAKEEYIAAVHAGQTAAHVEQNARDSNKFTVSVNVEAEKKVTFNLTYDQFLPRKMGVYSNIINIQPGQVVKNLKVIVDIEEASNITTLEVPNIKTTNEIETKVTKNELAQITRTSGNSTTITWSPSVKEQLTFSEQGVIGQFIVQYDVDHKSTPNQVLIDDGYFVHFFTPTDLKPLRTHVIFVLDVSGSMHGQKLPQVKDAMEQILSEILPEDFFTIILFSDFAQVWTLNATQVTSTRWDDMGVKQEVNSSLAAISESRFVFPATTENIESAKKFIKDLTPESSTNMEDALTKAIAIAKMGETKFEVGSNAPKPIIVFLTDGEPTTGITDSQELVKYVSNLRSYLEKYPIFSLGFGEGADMDFLKKLSLNNSGFARTIYEASDASLQLRNFYKEISSPVLSNVTFKYIDAQVDNRTVTKQIFNLLFRGTELVVAGALRDHNENFNSTLNADSIDGNFTDSGISICPIGPWWNQPKNVTITTQVGHLEKLWAYLHIQQLLDEYDLNKNENSSAKAKALELALKYSFVTPLTSLVVVKPNDTTTSAEPQKIRPAQSSSYNNLLYSSMALPAMTVHRGPISLKIGKPSATQSYGSSANIQQAEEEEPDTLTKIEIEPQINETSEKSLTLHSLSELTWLNGTNSNQPNITISATNTTYQVLLNTTNQSYQNCTTPDNTAGSCKHLKDCAISTILDSFDNYVSLFCLIENTYAGICCTI